MLATLIDSKALVESTVSALVACLALEGAFSLAVYGAARFADSRRQDGGAPAGAAAALALAALAVCGAVIVAGIVILISDRT
jgi:hypothetical protein